MLFITTLLSEVKNVPSDEIIAFPVYESYTIYPALKSEFNEDNPTCEENGNGVILPN